MTRAKPAFCYKGELLIVYFLFDPAIIIRRQLGRWEQERGKHREESSIIQGEFSIEGFSTDTKDVSSLLTVTFKKMQHFKDMPLLN
jgi:hypothetical protein